MSKITSDLTLVRLKKTTFPDIYKDFLVKDELCLYSLEKMLSLAVIFINSGNKHIVQLGYRIIIIYCNKTGDYRPLYEISINYGLIPISKLILSLPKYKDISTFNLLLNDYYSEAFFIDGLYRSVQQKELIGFYNTNINTTVAVVAPTSYGKTDLIISTIKQCKHKNICIITPTKALLAQTKLRIMSEHIGWVDKVITHPEMYNNDDEKIVAVLTQERAMRLLSKAKDLYFDLVVVDEAHGLLLDDNRNLLLASLIIILNKRNKNTVYKFLTPFLKETDNLKLRFSDYLIKSFEVTEQIKTEKYYIYKMDTVDYCNNQLYFYDQYLDTTIEIAADHRSDIDFIENNKAAKNIIYLNKPVDIEEFALRLSSHRKPINSEVVERICRNIAEYVNPNYNLLRCIRTGIIYHHGSVPDSIRLYIERVFTEYPFIEYIVTSSTLLEGVNLPAERIFLLDNKKGHSTLSPSNFKNLIGRICRFSDIFNYSNKDLKKLEPSIYLVVGKYYAINANPFRFLSRCAKVDNEVSDDPRNILLEKSIIDDNNIKKFNGAQELIENYENNTIENYQQRYVRTEVGKLAFLNNITEIDVFETESKLQKTIDRLKKDNLIISDALTLFDNIYRIFLINAAETDNGLQRFEHHETRRFYSMFLDWRISNASFAKMINSFLRYWEKLINDGRETVVFVGRWGDISRNGINELWTDIFSKTRVQRINLAIVRIKEEQDFLDNTLIKFIEVLNDLQLLDETFYLKIKYGTDDKRRITLVKNGLTLSLSNLLVEHYPSYIEVDIEKSTVSFNEKLLVKMVENQENQVLVNEAEFFADD